MNDVCCKCGQEMIGYSRKDCICDTCRKTAAPANEVPFEEQVILTMHLMKRKLREMGRTTSPENLRKLAEDFCRKNPGGYTRVTDPKKIEELNKIAFGGDPK